jgi:hypothetical protein
LLQQHITGRSLRIFGKPRVNVLTLNLALQRAYPKWSVRVRVSDQNAVTASGEAMALGAIDRSLICINALMQSSSPYSIDTVPVALLAEGEKSFIPLAACRIEFGRR